jgi:hypothetical protein
VVNESFDIVSRPSHYAKGRRFEPIDVIRKWNLNFNLGCVTKYVSRAGRKGDEIKDEIIDLEKSIVYITHEINSLEKESRK